MTLRFLEKRLRVSLAIVAIPAMDSLMPWRPSILTPRASARLKGEVEATPVDEGEPTGEEMQLAE